MKITMTKDHHVDEGEYVAKVVAVKEKQNKDKKGEDGGVYLQFSFLIKDPTEDGAPIEEQTIVNGNCSPKLTERTKLFKWLTAMGQEVQIGEEVEIDSVVGTVVRVQISDKDSQDRVYSNVTHVMRAKKKVQAPAAEDKPKEAPPQEVKPKADPPQESKPKVDAKPEPAADKPKDQKKVLFSFTDDDDDE